MNFNLIIAFIFHCFSFLKNKLKLCKDFDTKIYKIFTIYNTFSFHFPKYFNQHRWRMKWNINEYFYRSNTYGSPALSCGLDKNTGKNYKKNFTWFLFLVQQTIKLDLWLKRKKCKQILPREILNYTQTYTYIYILSDSLTYSLITKWNLCKEKDVTEFIFYFIPSKEDNNVQTKWFFYIF